MIESISKAGWIYFGSLWIETKDKYDKVLKFIEMAILSPRKVRYRDATSSKHSK